VAVQRVVQEVVDLSDDSSPDACDDDFDGFSDSESFGSGSFDSEGSGSDSGSGSSDGDGDGGGSDNSVYELRGRDSARRKRRGRRGGSGRAVRRSSRKAARQRKRVVELDSDDLPSVSSLSSHSASDDDADESRPRAGMCVCDAVTSNPSPLRPCGVGRCDLCVSHTLFLSHSLTRAHTFSCTLGPSLIFCGSRCPSLSLRRRRRSLWRQAAW
jgi:hypothetical protein